MSVWMVVEVVVDLAAAPPPPARCVVVDFAAADDSSFGLFGYVLLAMMVLLVEVGVLVVEDSVGAAAATLVPVRFVLLVVVDFAAATTTVILPVDGKVVGFESSMSLLPSRYVFLDIALEDLVKPPLPGWKIEVDSTATDASIILLPVDEDEFNPTGTSCLPFPCFE